MHNYKVGDTVKANYKIRCNEYIVIGIVDTVLTEAKENLVFHIQNVGIKTDVFSKNNIKLNKLNQPGDKIATSDEMSLIKILLLEKI